MICYSYTFYSHQFYLSAWAFIIMPFFHQLLLIFFSQEDIGFGKSRHRRAHVFVCHFVVQNEAIRPSDQQYSPPPSSPSPSLLFAAHSFKPGMWNVLPATPLVRMEIGCVIRFKRQGGGIFTLHSCRPGGLSITVFLVGFERCVP